MQHHLYNGIMGMCVADAIGVPVEFNSRESLRAAPVTDIRGYGTYHVPPGTWSDDTSMTLAMLDSLATGLDYKDIMDKFLSWLQEARYTPYDEVFDVGNATRKAIMKYAKGEQPLNCGGRSEYDNGNGSLMRILPLAYYLYIQYGDQFTEDKEAMTIIHHVSALTHAHPRSQIACGIYCSITSLLIEESELSHAIFTGIERARTYYEQLENYQDELQHYKRLWDIGVFRYLPEDEIRSSGYVVDSLEAAIWCLLNTNDYRNCVLKAVNLGEDTDTVASIAGGLAGLSYGVEQIPQHWLAAIPKRDYIEQLCNSLSDKLQQLQVERLVAYIPYLQQATGESVTKWAGGEKLGERHYTLPFPVYDQPLEDFIHLVTQSTLMRHDYTTILDSYDFNDLEKIKSALATADLDLVGAILTFCIRSERFCEGFWATAVDEGIFIGCMQRLQQLTLHE